MENSKDEFIKSIFKINKDNNLDWEKRCQEAMSLYSIVPHTEAAIERQNRLEKIKTTEYTHRIDRMEKEAAKTTILYRSINQYIDQPLFTRINLRRMHAIALIAQLRGGANFTNNCKYIRHQSETATCPCCQADCEDEIHIIENCPRYTDERNILIDKLEKITKNELKELKLHEIVLYSTKFEQIINRKLGKNGKIIDNLIKNFIENIYKLRNTFKPLVLCLNSGFFTTIPS